MACAGLVVKQTSSPVIGKPFTSVAEATRMLMSTPETFCFGYAVSVLLHWEIAVLVRVFETGIAGYGTASYGYSAWAEIAEVPIGLPSSPCRSQALLRSTVREALSYHPVPGV